MRREIEAITSKARKSRRELRGVVVALMLLGCSTHLAFAHATINVPASPVAPQEPAAVVVAAQEREAPVDVAHAPREWMPPSRRGCLRMARCNATRRVPRPSAQDAERAAALGVGDDRAARALLAAPPRAEWVEAVDAEPVADLLWPVPEGRFGRGVGRTRERRIRRIPHQGVDIVAPQGSPILAVNDGIVAYSDNGIHGYGNLVVIVHADGTSSHYAHCHATFVVAGQRVQRGEVIAEVGATGLARGAHLHFEWRSGARYRDPMARFSERPRGQ
jgi:murein DD-endopeptidase MepM/ murein hydrolase activator NlpD